jgi:hypothetical protein
MNKVPMKLFAILLSIIPFICDAQISKQDSLWLPFKPFIGKWVGESEGQPGKGKYERSYEFIFNNKFIEVKNKSSYPPSERKPNGEVHLDHGFISYDRMRKTFMLRQFHIEGFVIQYKIESISPDNKTIVYISESIENIPAGFRARETYTVEKDQITETFELAEPGKEFEIYSKAVLKKLN